ncbi:hypothetical protein C791_0969 [Amycolatopsis azurea DSM 43854]|uniref:Uncharacterized protein n=1 Tax=Amycolatopsis azurea DSM 43854 TaxID=1238180 RepID=M2NHQ6_9PSEU|nr:hypothetical protein C791_0969 [Amycolatopsis azurea DSM 43854]
MFSASVSTEARERPMTPRSSATRGSSVDSVSRAVSSSPSSRSRASEVPFAASPAAPRTAQVVTAVVVACRTGLRRPARSASTPASTAEPARPPVHSTPATGCFDRTFASTVEAALANAVTGRRDRGSPIAPSAATPNTKPIARAALTVAPCMQYPSKTCRGYSKIIRSEGRPSRHAPG